MDGAFRKYIHILLNKLTIQWTISHVLHQKWFFFLEHFFLRAPVFL